MNEKNRKRLLKVATCKHNYAFEVIDETFWNKNKNMAIAKSSKIAFYGYCHNCKRLMYKDVDTNKILEITNYLFVSERVTEDF